MFKKILVAIDTSAISHVAFEEAVALAKQTGASLVLLHILSPESQDYAAMSPALIPYYYPIITDTVMDYYRQRWQEHEQKGLEMLRSLAKQATLAGVTVETIQNVGTPGSLICQLAQDLNIDLIVMGRRGYSGFSELLLGSISNYVLHHAPCTVMLVQGEKVKESKMMFSKILVALDYSDMSRAVFDQAVALAKATGAELMLLHVLCSFDTDYPNISIFPEINTLSPDLYEEAMQRYAQQWQEFERHNLSVIRGFAHEAEDAGVKVDYTQFLADPATTICSVAKTWEADLIMVGRRGRRGLSELLLGSVSNHVTHHAGCSVLVVQGEQRSTSTLDANQQAVAV